MTQYKDSAFYPVFDQLHAKTNEVILLINSIESEMVAESQGKPGNPAETTQQIVKTENGQEIRLEFLSNPFSTEPVRDFLLPGAAARLELEKALTGYKDFLSATISSETLQNLNKMLDPAVCLPAKTPDEEKDLMLLSGLHCLALLKNSLLAVESCSMSSIANH